MKLYRTLCLIAVVAGLPFVNPAPASATGHTNKNNIVIAAERAPNTTRVWAVTANGQRQLLTTGQVRSLRTSPNGAYLAYIRTLPNGNGRLEVIQIYNRAVTYTTTNPHYHESSPKWSSDGTRLAFVRNRHNDNRHQSAIFTTTLDNQQANVTGWQTKLSYHSLSWAPDNQQLTYEQRQDGHPHTLYIQSLNHNQPRKVVALSDQINSQVSWSPSGRKLLYRDSVTETYTIWPDGSHRTVISDGDSYHATWAPDGQRIAFIEDIPTNEISISQTDGSINYLSLPNSPPRDISLLSWSPDGERLAYKADSTINIIEPQTGKHRLLHGFQHPISEIAWQSER